MLRARVALLRPLYAPSDPADRTAYRPGDIVQCDLWFPAKVVPVAAEVLIAPPVLTMVAAWSGFIAAVLLPTRQSADLLAGMWQLLAGSFGAVPRMLVWDNEAGIGQHQRLTVGARAFAGTLGTRIWPPAGPGSEGGGGTGERVDLGRHYGTTVHTCVPYDPQSKGGVEASVRVAQDDLLPKKTNLRDEYGSMDELAEACRGFMAKVNARVHQATRRRPDEALVVERGFLHPVPMEPHTAALGQARIVAPDQTVSFGSVRYSVPPKLQGAPVWVAVQGDEVVIRADARRLPVVPDWAAGQGLVEVARHRTSTPGNPRINLSHYPDHPQNPDGSPAVPRPRAGSLLEQVFMSIGPAAELWLVAACARGVERIESKMRAIVDLAALRGSELTCAALEAATQADRFGWGDVESIADFIATTSHHDDQPVVADEASSTQPGTGGWAGFTTSPTGSAR